MSKEFDWNVYLKGVFGNPDDSGVLLGVGDDCALFEGVPEKPWAVSSDFVIFGTHIDAGATVHQVAHKALARGVSDLVSGGALPRFYLSNVAVSQSTDGAFLQDFCAALKAVSGDVGLSCLGGDTSFFSAESPRYVINVTMLGQRLERGAFSWSRAGVCPGDDLYVTGDIGRAGLAVFLKAHGKQPAPLLLDRLYCPPMYVGLVESLLGCVHGCTDVSDGFMCDLMTILHDSNCGATLFYDQFPLHQSVCGYMDDARYWPAIFNGGDDYELIFSASPVDRQKIHDACLGCGVRLSRIGKVERAAGEVHWDDKRFNQQFNLVLEKILRQGHVSVL